MRVVSCLDPQTIVNPHTHERLTVACGKCRACRNALAKRWINKLEHERRCWKYCYFVTLTYSDDNLPVLYDDGYCCLVSKDGSTRIPFQDLKFNSPRDVKYFNDRINHNLGIPFTNVRDIQLLNKRINKYIHDKFTQKYQNFRYFICSEYGKDSFRPHYHGLYFFNEQQIAAHIEEIFLSCWSHGDRTKNRFDAVSVCGTASSYCAQYINMHLDLPSIYQSGKLKPFYIFSKQPPIGSLQFLDEDVSRIFFDGTPTRVDYDWKANKFIDVRLSNSFENRLFPKIPRYSEVSLYDRARLYRLVNAADAETFHGFLVWLKNNFCGLWSPKYLKFSEYGKVCFSYLNWLTNGFRFEPNSYVDPKDFESVINRVHRFYTVSKRVCSQANVFGISVRNYVEYIDNYYSNLSKFKLKQFYDEQQKYSCAHDLEDLAFMYQNPEDFLISNKLEYVPQISETFAFVDLFRTAEKIYNDSTKTHHKNDYLDRMKDKKLSLILKDYFM